MSHSSHSVIVAQAVRKPSTFGISVCVSWWNDGQCDESENRTVYTLNPRTGLYESHTTMGYARPIPWETYDEERFYKSEFAEAFFGNAVRSHDKQGV